MIRHLRELERTGEAILMVSVNDHGCRSASPTGRSEPRTGRWVGVGVLVMTLEALVLGLVDTSPTRPASAARTSVIPATPPPALRSSPQQPKPAPLPLVWRRTVIRSPMRTLPQLP